MREFNVTLGENGRMIIPALFRRTLELKPGDEVIVKLSENNDILVHSPKQSLKNLQALIKEKTGSESLVEELIQMRHNEEI